MSELLFTLHFLKIINYEYKEIRRWVKLVVEMTEVFVFYSTDRPAAKCAAFWLFWLLWVFWVFRVFRVTRAVRGLLLPSGNRILILR